MPEKSKTGTKNDDLRKNLVKAARNQYLAGIGRSHSWDEVKQMAITQAPSRKKSGLQS